MKEVKLDKLILVGDSAGGNLALSLCYLAIENNVRIPDGICLIYPALNLSNFHYK